MANGFERLQKQSQSEILPFIEVGLTIATRAPRMPLDRLCVRAMLSHMFEQLFARRKVSSTPRPLAFAESRRLVSVSGDDGSFAPLQNQHVSLVVVRDCGEAGLHTPKRVRY